MRFMLTALVVGAFGIQAGIALGLAPSAPIPPTSILANVVGWRRLRRGDGHGGMVFGLLQPVIMPTLAGVGALGRVAFASLAGASPWLALLVFGQVVVLVLMLIARVGRKTT